MNSSTESNAPLLNEDQAEAFSEFINIALGRAAVPLAELVEEFVTMQVPQLSFVETSRILPELTKIIGVDQRVVIVRQGFQASLRGEAIFVLGTPSTATIREMLDLEDDEDLAEGVLEIANIVLGASVGELAKLLGGYVTYSPPHIVVNDGLVTDLTRNSGAELSESIFVRTGLGVEAHSLETYLLLLLPEGTLGWLRNALDEVLEAA